MDHNSVRRDIDGEFFAYAGSGQPLRVHRTRFDTAPTEYGPKTRAWRYAKTRRKGMRFGPSDHPKRHTNEVSTVYKLADRDEQQLEMLTSTERKRNRETDTRVQDLEIKLPNGATMTLAMDKNYRARNQRNLDIRDSR